MIEAAVFDLGYTIVDFASNEEVLLAAYQEACGILAGYLLGEAPRAREQIERATYCLERRIEESRLRLELHELNFLAAFAGCFQEFRQEIPESLIDQVTRLEQRALRAEMHLWPDNARALRAMRAAGFHLGLVSDLAVRGDWVRELLDDLGLLDLFDVLVLPADESIGIARAEAYQAALNRLGIEGRHAVLVGDQIGEEGSETRAIGMGTILTRQFRREAPANAGLDAIINRLTDLPAVVCALRAASGY